MPHEQHLRTAVAFYVLAVVIFVIQQAIGLPGGGAAAQEGFEILAAPADYTARLIVAGGGLRIVLMLDLFFIISFAGAIGLTAYACSAKNLPMAWVAGLGIGLVAGLDIWENTTMLLSLDMAQSGAEIPAERIVSQVTISSLKWLASAPALVALTLVLPYETLLERFLVWSTRFVIPVGTGLFVSGAFGAHDLGGLLLVTGLPGGMAMLALVLWLRVSRT